MQIDNVKVKSLYKALRLLDCFDAQNPERGISELSEQSGMLKSSVHNIISTFEVCGFVEKNKKTNKYRLGLKLLELSNLLNASDDFKKAAKPIMDALAQKTGETVFLATLYRRRIIYTESAYPEGLITAIPIKGVTAPMYCTSIGKAILAFQPESFIEEVIAEGFEQFTPNTILDPEIFRNDLKRIHDRGYSIDNMEHEYGIKCVGVPILDSSNKVTSALSLTGPSLRFTDEKINEYSLLLKDCAKEMHKRMQ